MDKQAKLESDLLETRMLLRYISPELVEGLRFLATVQRSVSSPVEGAIPADDDMPTKDAIRTYVLALTVELMEFLQTLNWKPWKEKPHLDRNAVVGEFADILAFLGIIIHYLNCYGFSCTDLAAAYSNKSIVNIERFLGEHGAEYMQASLLKGDEK